MVEYILVKRTKEYDFGYHEGHPVTLIHDADPSIKAEYCAVFEDLREDRVVLRILSGVDNFISMITDKSVLLARDELPAILAPFQVYALLSGGLRSQK